MASPVVGVVVLGDRRAIHFIASVRSTTNVQRQSHQIGSLVNLESGRAGRFRHESARIAIVVILVQTVVDRWIMVQGHLGGGRSGFYNQRIGDEGGVLRKLEKGCIDDPNRCQACVQ